MCQSDPEILADAWHFALIASQNSKRGMDDIDDIPSALCSLRSRLLIVPLFFSFFFSKTDLQGA
jgi:hypothetical protein